MVAEHTETTSQITEVVHIPAQICDLSFAKITNANRKPHPDRPLRRLVCLVCPIVLHRCTLAYILHYTQA